jgi:DNA-binding transcriptional ArsR family regulator
MLAVAVIDDPAAATVALDPARSRLLAELAQPASAAALAARLGIPRQKINYHLRALEAHGLVQVADTRQWGGLTERRMVATAASYVVSPGALGPAGADPARERDRLSASYLIALAARAVREVGGLFRRARAADQHLATLSIDAEIRFRSAAERAAFTAELTEAVAGLAARYHDPVAPGGRPHRLIVLAHPLPRQDAPSDATPSATDAAEAQQQETPPPCP